MTEPDLSPAGIERLQQALLIGLARQPLAGDGLTALALLGQRLRYDRPAAPGPASETRQLPDDPRPLLPDRARAALRRLIATPDKSVSGRLNAAAIARIARAGLRLHPFDFTALEPVLRRHEGEIDPVAR